MRIKNIFHHRSTNKKEKNPQRFTYKFYRKNCHLSSVRKIFHFASTDWYLDQIEQVASDLEKNVADPEAFSLLEDANFLTRAMWNRMAEENIKSSDPNPGQEKFEHLLDRLIQVSKNPNFSDYEKKERVLDMNKKFQWRKYTLSAYPIRKEGITMSEGRDEYIRRWRDVGFDDFSECTTSHPR